MEKAYVLRYQNTAIFYFVTTNKNRLNNVNDWVRSEDSFYEFCFSPILKTGNISNYIYITTEVLDKSSNNIKKFVLQLKDLFSIDTYVENTKRKSCKKTQLEKEALERIIELHKQKDL